MPQLPPYLFRRQGPPPLWTSEQLYFDGDEYYADIIHELDHAQKLITIEMYIFEDDPLGERIFQSLERAAQRGVEIFILLDGVGSHRFIQKLQERHYHERIKIKVYNPHPWTFSQDYFQGLIRACVVFLRRLLGVNRRNHRKVITVDELTLFTGSFNISTSHSKEFKSDEAWHDIGLKLTGWIAPLMILSLMKNWSLARFFRYRRQMPKKKFLRFQHPDLRLNQDFNLRRQLYRDFLQKLKKSKQRVWLATGYFQPKRRIIRLLKAAAKRGVDVRILLSTKSDVFYYGLLQTYYHHELVKAGVRIFEFDPTIIHAKNYFIDDWVSVGSTNLNYRSFMHDLEVDFRIQHPDNKKRLELNFEEQQRASTEVTQARLDSRPWWMKLFARFVFLFRYWN